MNGIGALDNNELRVNQRVDEDFSLQNVNKTTINNTIKATNKRKVTIAGDSMLKGIVQHKMRESVSRKDIVYLKSFSGATIADMKDYIKPSLKHLPSPVVLHTGTNDLRSTKNEHISK